MNVSPLSGSVLSYLSTSDMDSMLEFWGLSPTESSFNI